MHLYRQVIRLFTPEELERFAPILEFELNKKEWDKATIISNNKTLVSSYRDTEMKTLPIDSAPGAILSDRINYGATQYANNLRNVYGDYALSGTSITAPDTESRLQPLQVLRYRAGQHYQWHVDQNSDDLTDVTARRSLSVVLYLKDDFEGGGTEFPDRTFRPNAGEALFFPSTWDFPHRAQRVEKGEKMVVVTWFEVKKLA